MKNIGGYNYYVYITTNPNRTAFYTGVTNEIDRRLIEHYANRGRNDTWAGKFFCYCLIHYEWFQHIELAIQREKEIKGWRREKKLDLAKKENPSLIFMNAQVCGEWPPAKVWKPYYDDLKEQQRLQDEVEKLKK